MQPATRPLQEPEAVYGCSCCGCNCCAKGNAQFEAAVDRTCVSPGDVIRIALNAQNLTQDQMKFEVKIVTSCRLRANFGQTITGKREEVLVTQNIEPQGKLVWPSANPQVLTIPGLPPTFSGNTLGRLAGKDPLTWFHILVLSLGGMDYFSSAIEWKLPLFIGAIPAAVVQVVQPTAISGAHTLEWKEDEAPAQAVEFPGAPDGGAIVVEAVVVDFIPQQVHDLTKNTVPALQTGEVDLAEHQDDNHFGDTVAYAPQYPAPLEPSPLLCVMPEVGEVPKEQDMEGEQAAPAQQNMG